MTIVRDNEKWNQRKKYDLFANCFMETDLSTIKPKIPRLMKVRFADLTQHFMKCARIVPPMSPKKLRTILYITHNTIRPCCQKSFAGYTNKHHMS